MGFKCRQREQSAGLFCALTAGSSVRWTCLCACSKDFSTATGLPSAPREPPCAVTAVALVLIEFPAMLLPFTLSPHRYESPDGVGRRVGEPITEPSPLGRAHVHCWNDSRHSFTSALDDFFHTASPGNNRN